MAAAADLLEHRAPVPDPEAGPPRILVADLGTTKAQRLLAIDQLIGRCEPTQVRHMMAVIEPQFQRDFISLLPKEVRAIK